MMYVMVIGGFVLLFLAAELLVRGAVAIATNSGVSPLVIGMTVVAFGTSAPEFVVSVQASLDGAGGLALGNVVGSNIANILLIMGSAGLMAPIVLKSDGQKLDGLVLVLGTALFAGLCLAGVLGFYSGLALLVAFFVFVTWNIWREKRRSQNDHKKAGEVEGLQGLAGNQLLAWFATIGGLLGIVLGADLLVEGGVDIARSFQVPEEVIGLTLIAIGTSLPELAASVVAALRGHPEVAVGNVVGSNLFNLLGVAGAAAVTATIPVSEAMLSTDLWVMVLATVIFLPFLVLGRTFGRLAGIAFLAAYIGYIGFQARFI